ncbi:SCO family protein [Nocardioides sp. JQ2195]|uniref:SCO family protein n=1 Tax=Nocardioides sp. JQ2195 TaxID=2592334 RepID=UPI00143EB89D|nr:SCO family protein [Nocardioides sp. JQ2195]QIX26396.1 SCO family protein [Nocardioides sp. JQ2195]
MARRGRWWGAVLLAAVLAASGCSQGTGNPTGELGSTDVGEPWALPDTELVDTGGADFALADDADKPVTLVFFGYTNCPDICQLVMSNIASALTRLDDDQRDRVEVVFVTTDPARDTEKALRRYLDRFDPSFVGLTGSMKRINELGDAFHVAIDKGEKLASGGYDVTHGTQIFLVDDQEVPMFWRQETSSAELADDLVLLLEDA